LTIETELTRLRTLYQLLDALTRAKSLAEVYQAAITSLLAATTADRIAILAFDDHAVLGVKAWHGLSAKYREQITGHSPWDKGDPDAQVIAVRDVLLDESLRPYRELFAAERIRSAVFVPMSLGEGVFGNLALYYAEPHETNPDESAVAKAIAGHVAIATERARTEQARAASEQRLKAILDNSTTIVFLKDLQGRYALVNRCFEDLFHVTQTEASGRTDYDIFPHDIADRFVENDRKVISAGAPLTVEERAPHPDGSMHTYISVKFPMNEPDGLLTGICGISTDITDRKRLEVSRQHLAAIVASSDDAIIGESLDGVITSWNHGAQRIFGYSAEEVVGMPLSLLAPPDRRDEMPELLRRLLHGEHVEHYETHRVRKDGQIIDVSLTFSPVLDESGRIVGASKVARDITERKKAEEERTLLLAREQEARHTAELLNRVAPRLLAELNLERLVQTITETATTLVAAEVGVFIGNSVRPNESGSPYTVAGMAQQEFDDFLEPGFKELLEETLRREAVACCGDLSLDRAGNGALRVGGASQIRSYLSAPVISRSGEVLGALFFGHSLPEKFAEPHESILTGIAAEAAIAIDNARLFAETKWAQGELQRSNQELRRANQDLETFAYSASHDLQEPLRTIAISAQLLDRNAGAGFSPEDTALLARIHGAAHHMSTLVHDLLNYTRTSKGAEGPPTRVDPEAVLAGVLDTLNGPILEASATVTSDPLPPVHVHEARLGQLFQNLISNAIKFHGAQPPRVHVSAIENDGWVVFSVSDNGLGIEPQYSKQIFGLFKRLHGRDRYPGSGIGLSICQRIVEQHGGRIWLEKSAPNQGSTFCFALPGGPS
jgi:PAS domain S-box-containing protein